MPTEGIDVANAATGAGGVDAASQKQDLARQLISAERNADGGLFAQLTSNPFFTAVSLLPIAYF